MHSTTSTTIIRICQRRNSSYALLVTTLLRWIVHSTFKQEQFALQRAVSLVHTGLRFRECQWQRSCHFHHLIYAKATLLATHAAKPWSAVDWLRQQQDECQRSTYSKTRADLVMDCFSCPLTSDGYLTSRVHRIQKSQFDAAHHGPVVRENG